MVSVSSFVLVGRERGYEIGGVEVIKYSFVIFFFECKNEKLKVFFFFNLKCSY